MSLQIPPSAAPQTRENDVLNTQAQGSLSNSVYSTFDALVPKVAYQSYAHSTKDASDASSPAPSLPTIIEDGRTSMQLHSSTGASANDVTLERLRWRLASGFFAYFMCGWGDGVTGAVLPYFMADYHIDFMMSSLLYAATTVGFVVGTFLVESIVNQLGSFDLTSTQYSWIPRINISCLFIRNPGDKQIGYSPSQARHVAMLVSSILHGMFFVMMGSRGGFWVAFGAYAVAAFARSILTASLNSYFAEGPQQSLGYAFGLWSFGGMASPLLCQSLTAINVPWFKFYLGSLILSTVNVALLVTAFKPTGREFIRDRQYAINEASRCTNENAWSKNVSTTNDVECVPASDSPSETIATNKKALSSALKLRYQWAICVFSLLYCGCETTTSGFMVSYLLDIRNANPRTVGYVASGFWGGITIGRFIWGYLTPKLDHAQRKIVIEICMLIGLTMQVMIWAINSNIENSVSTSVIGLVYGPVFPASLTLANDILPFEIRMISMALISASASFGSALFPFIAGTISSLKGIHTLTYITVSLAGTLACLWALFPSKLSSRQVNAA